MAAERHNTLSAAICIITNHKPQETWKTDSKNCLLQSPSATVRATYLI